MFSINTVTMNSSNCDFIVFAGHHSRLFCLLTVTENGRVAWSCAGIAGWLLVGRSSVCLLKLGLSAKAQHYVLQAQINNVCIYSNDCLYHIIWFTQQSCSVSCHPLEPWKVPLSRQGQRSVQQLSVSRRCITKTRQSSYHRQLRLGKYLVNGQGLFTLSTQQQINSNKL